MLLINIHTGGCWGPTLDTGDLFNRYPGHAALAAAQKWFPSFLVQQTPRSLCAHSAAPEDVRTKLLFSQAAANTVLVLVTLHPSSHTLAPVTRPHTALLHGQNLQTEGEWNLRGNFQNNRKLCGHGWDWEQAGLVAVSCKL